LKKRKEHENHKNEKRHAQELIPESGQMVKTTEIKDIPHTTVKNNLQTSAIKIRKK
jgi:preprotein translocase subunit YajC